MSLGEELAAAGITPSPTGTSPVGILPPKPKDKAPAPPPEAVATALSQDSKALSAATVDSSSGNTSVPVIPAVVVAPPTSTQTQPSKPVEPQLPNQPPSEKAHTNIVAVSSSSQSIDDEASEPKPLSSAALAASQRDLLAGKLQGVSADTPKQGLVDSFVRTPSFGPRPSPSPMLSPALNIPGVILFEKPKIATCHCLNLCVIIRGEYTEMPGEGFPTLPTLPWSSSKAIALACEPTVQQSLLSQMTYLEQWKVARCLACQCDVIAMSVIASEGAEQRQMKSDLSKAVLNSSLIIRNNDAIPPPEMIPKGKHYSSAYNMIIDDSLPLLSGTISDPAGKHATEILKKLQAESDLFVAKQKEIAVNKIRAFKAQQYDLVRQAGNDAMRDKNILWRIITSSANANWFPNPKAKSTAPEDSRNQQPPPAPAPNTSDAQPLAPAPAVTTADSAQLEALAHDGVFAFEEELRIREQLKSQQHDTVDVIKKKKKRLQEAAEQRTQPDQPPLAIYSSSVPIPIPTNPARRRARKMAEGNTDNPALVDGDVAEDVAKSFVVPLSSNNIRIAQLHS